MASVIKQKTAKGIRHFIQLSSGENEARPKIALGKVNKRQADTAKVNIENIVKCKDTGAVASPAVQEWLDDISDGLRKRLETLNIIEPRNGGQSHTAVEWTKLYIDSRPDVKEITRVKLQNTANKLSAFFKGQDIGSITIQQAKDFRVYLQNVVGLAENSIRRQIGISRQFFNAAMNTGLISKNPFMGQPVTVRANSSRFYYITQEMALKVLDACPDVAMAVNLWLGKVGRFTLSQRSPKANLAGCGL
jgi:hypothetical protein